MVQEAIDAAVVNKTTIRVCPGTYRGTVSIDENNVDGLTIRAVKPWTATLMPTSDQAPDTDLITIREVAHTQLVWLNMVFPTQTPCAKVNIAIRVEDAPDTSLRANHLRETGTDTLGDCGYSIGMSMRNSPGSTIAWNRIVDYRVRGINVSLSNGADVRGNTVRYRHADESEAGGGNGIVLHNSPHSSIQGNAVVSPSSAGTTTPIMQSGITVLGSDDTLLSDNRVFWVLRGIQAFNSNSSTISGNRVRHTTIVGFQLQTNGSTIQDNSAHAGDGTGIDVNQTSHDDLLIGNDFRNNGGTDCVDHSPGPANTWIDNLGDESTPPGICIP
jgi:parallel beta-helix repeat protein